MNDGHQDRGSDRYRAVKDAHFRGCYGNSALWKATVPAAFRIGFAAPPFPVSYPRADGKWINIIPYINTIINHTVAQCHHRALLMALFFKCPLAPKVLYSGRFLLPFLLSEDYSPFQGWDEQVAMWEREGIIP